MYTTIKINSNVYKDIRETSLSKEKWNRLFYSFEIDGKAYIVVHGCEDGTLDVPFEGHLTGDKFYEYVTKYLEVFKYGRKINVICCYGGIVKENMRKYKQYMTFVNDTLSAGKLSVAKKDNDDYEMLVYSNDSLLNKAKGFFYKALNS